jgi:uncharacterized membrane protein YedE/YeeE
MAFVAAAFASGLVFGLGLIVSQMVDPQKVLAFLDLFGNWDPSLASVMAGAVAVSGLGWILARRRGTPVLVPRLEMPSRRDIDAPLLAGAALFGVGWGLIGFCPGPALTALAFGPIEVLLFVAAMLAGMALFQLLPDRGPQATARSAPAPVTEDA